MLHVMCYVRGIRFDSNWHWQPKAWQKLHIRNRQQIFDPSISTTDPTNVHFFPYLWHCCKKPKGCCSTPPQGEYPSPVSSPMYKKVNQTAPRLFFVIYAFVCSHSSPSVNLITLLHGWDAQSFQDRSLRDAAYVNTPNVDIRWVTSAASLLWQDTTTRGQIRRATTFLLFPFIDNRHLLLSLHAWILIVVSYLQGYFS